MIKESGRFLKRSYKYDPADLEKLGKQAEDQVRLQTKLELDETGCEAFVGQLLFSRWLVLTPTSPERGEWEWVYLLGPQRARVTERTLTIPPDTAAIVAPLMRHVKTTIPLTHTDARTVVNMLRPFLASRGLPLGSTQLTADGDRACTITGWSDRVFAVMLMIQENDRPPAPPEVLPQRLMQLEALLNAFDGRADKRD